MTGDGTLNIYLNELQRIINELDNLISEINTNVAGLGQEKCTASLQFVSTCYTNIKNNIIANYY